MEDGIYGQLKVPAAAFVTDMGASDGQHTYAIYQGNAQSGAPTTTGVIPLPNGYQPMRQEGAIILGIGGDNSNWATGYCFEGVMTRGVPTTQSMGAVQSNIVATGYTGQLKPSQIRGNRFAIWLRGERNSYFTHQPHIANLT